jgi:signal transduction histidine kinase
MQLRVNTSENKKPDWISILVRYRWAIAVVYIILVFFFEVAEQFRQDFLALQSPIFWIKIIFLELLVPAIFLVTTHILDKKLSHFNNLGNALQTKAELLQLLSIQMDEKEFCVQVVTFLESHFSPTKVHISLLHSKTQAPGEDEAISEQDPLIESICTSLGDSCANLPDDVLPNAILAPGDQGDPEVHRYCLSLLSEHQSIGVIALDLPPDQSFSPEQILLFKRIAVLLVLKIIQIQLNSQLHSLSLRYEFELRHISQNLHDTLGQSIGFIRLKMEAIRHDFPSRRFPELAQELDRVQSVTEEAYQQVRGILAELHPNSAVDLTTALSTQAALNAQRAGFEFQLEEIGEPRPLLPLVKRQLIYIFREALNNIERHAQSRRVGLYIEWENSTCKISLKDDGVGFTPIDLHTPDHYGLIIMQERAQDISARFILDSSPGKGTQITLVVPLTQSMN